MKSEQIKQTGCFLGIVLVFLFCSHADAGNKWMMEKMGQNLIRMNNEVVKKIVGAENNSHVSLKARIVQDNGRQLIVIDDLDVSSPAAIPETLQEKSSEYQTYISYQALDIPGAETLPLKPLRTGTMVLDVKELEVLMDKHPEGQVIQLQQDMINAINWKNQNKPDHVYLFFW